MLVKNTFTHDARVLREAKTLQQAGYQVQVVALGAPDLAETETTSDGIVIDRVSRGPGSSLRAVSDPTRAHNSTSRPAATLKRQAVRLVKYAARSPLSSYVQRGIDERMLARVVEFSPDIIHAHDLNTLEVAVALKKKLGVPLVYDSHEIASDRNHHTSAQKRKSESDERRLLPNVDHVIMVSHGCAQYTTDKYGITLPTVIMNTPELSSAEAATRSLRAEFTIPESHTVLVHQGSLQKNRGVEETIQAVREIPDCTYIIIGYGQHRPFLEEFVRTENLSDKVKFFGPVPSEQLVEWAASADIGICTIVGKTKSYLYAMPNKLFEYTMAGLPVVASNYPDMGTYVSDNHMGVTCDPESPQDIRRAINELISNPDLRRQCAEGSREARNRFNWSVEKEKLLAIYNELGASK